MYFHLPESGKALQNGIQVSIEYMKMMTNRSCLSEKNGGTPFSTFHKVSILVVGEPKHANEERENSGTQLELRVHISLSKADCMKSHNVQNWKSRIKSAS